MSQNPFPSDARLTAIPSALPPGLVYQRRTPVFTQRTVPAALLSGHKTGQGVYGLIHVLDGRLRYYLEDGSMDSQLAHAGEDVVIEPEILHRVELIDPETEFRVEFYRTALIPVTDAGQRNDVRR